MDWWAGEIEGKGLGCMRKRLYYRKEGIGKSEKECRAAREMTEGLRWRGAREMVVWMEGRGMEGGRVAIKGGYGTYYGSIPSGLFIHLV